MSLREVFFSLVNSTLACNVFEVLFVKRRVFSISFVTGSNQIVRWQFSAMRTCNRRRYDCVRFLDVLFSKKSPDEGKPFRFNQRRKSIRQKDSHTWAHRG